jgi:hypothetical protein
MSSENGRSGQPIMPFKKRKPAVRQSRDHARWPTRFACAEREIGAKALLAVDPCFVDTIDSARKNLEIAKAQELHRPYPSP